MYTSKTVENILEARVCTGCYSVTPCPNNTSLWVGVIQATCVSLSMLCGYVCICV